MNQTRYYAFFDDDIHRDSDDHYDASYSFGRRHTPYTVRRYKILGFVKRGHTYFSEAHHDMGVYDVFRPPVTLGEQRRGMRVPLRLSVMEPMSPKVLHLRQEEGPTFRPILWRTRSSLWYEAQQQWIPVLGISEPEKLMGNYLYEADPDTRDDCIARQMVQQSERMAILEKMARGMLYAGDEFDAAVYESLVNANVVMPPQPLPSAPQERPPPAAALAPPATPPPPPAPLPPAPLPAATGTIAPRYVLELVKENALQKDDSCPISITPFKECDSVTITNCFHLFETASIAAWLSKKDSCPVCKQKVVCHAVV